MDTQIFFILLQDGLTSGLIYALLAIALVLICLVTRIVYVPQGEFVTFGALSFASLQAGKVPGTIGLLLTLAGLATVAELWSGRRRDQVARSLKALSWTLVLPLSAAAVGYFASGHPLPAFAQAFVAVALVAPMGPLIFRVAFQPVAEAPVLVLLIVGLGVHFGLMGLGLAFFGSEGSKVAPFSDASLRIGSLELSSQVMTVAAVSVVLIVGLYLFFDRSLRGKALIATAESRQGARLMGISVDRSAQLAFGLAACIGALSGVLIAPITTVYYDTGFLIGLKGFVGAIVGGLSSYPVAALGALVLGIVEAFASFYASAFKEAIVFGLLIPTLAWISYRSEQDEAEED